MEEEKKQEVVEQPNAVEEAIKTLEADKQKRGEECLAEIKAILQKYNCDLVAKTEVKPL